MSVTNHTPINSILKRSVSADVARTEDTPRSLGQKVSNKFIHVISKLEPVAAPGFADWRGGGIGMAIFTALHVMQTRYSEENSVCLSVRHTRDP